MGTQSKRKKQTHATNSFEQSVAIAVARQMNGELQKYAQNIYTELQNNFNRDFGKAFRVLGISIETLLELMTEKTNLTEEEYNNRKLTVEDRVDGLVASTTGVVSEGDRVRFTIKDVNADNAITENMMIDNLSAKKPQLLGGLDEAILGMKAGETKTLTVNLGDEQNKNEKTFELSVLKVSSKVVKDEEKATQEAANSEVSQVQSGS